MELKDNLFAAIAASILLLFGGYVIGSVILLTAFAAMLALITLDYINIWLKARSIKRNLVVTRSFSRKEISPGSDADLTVDLTYMRGLPLKLHISQPLNDTIISEPLPADVKLSAGSRQVLHIRLKPTKYGDHYAGPLKIVADSLLFKDTRSVGGEEKLEVRPAMGQPARRPNAMRHGDDGYSHAIEKVIEKRGGSDFSGVRRYEAGDNLKHIDWSLSNSHQGIVVREYEDERTLPVFYLLDVDASMAPGNGRSSLEEAIELTIKLIDRTLADSEGVGLLCFSRTDVVQSVSSGGGRHQAERFKDALSKIKPNDGAYPIRPASASMRDLQEIGRAFDEAAGKDVLGPILEETLTEYEANINKDGFSRAILTVVRSSKKPCNIVVMTNLSMGMASLLNGIRLAKYYGHSISVILMSRVWYTEKELTDIDTHDDKYLEIKEAVARLRARSIKVSEIGPDKDAKNIFYGGRIKLRSTGIRK
jgi:uncharacterized protein (DUF58 family)